MGIICSTSKKAKPEPSYAPNPPKEDLQEPSKPSLNTEITNSFTFKVDSVELSKGPHNFTTAEDILRKQVLSVGDIEGNKSEEREFKGRIEDFSHRQDKDAKYLSSKIPGLVGAIHSAFESRYALSLSASDFIILMGQGLGDHMNRLFDEKGFVNYEGGQSIEVKRDQFVLGGQNDWLTIFDEIAEQIKGRIKADVCGVIKDNTSVATRLSKIASEVTMNWIIQFYFLGEVETSSDIPENSRGIPEITLEGVPEDWQKLKDKVRKLVEMNKDDCLGLNEWLDQLVPVVNKICEAGIERKVDREFWSKIYKYHRIEGGDRITGWITRFFPCLMNFPIDKNYHCDAIRVSFILKQANEVPFTWSCNESKIRMIFNAGFLGAEFNKELCQVKAAHFWSVTQAEEREKT